MRIWIVAMGALALSGCMARYAVPHPMEAQASITFDKGHADGLRFGGNSVSVYAVEQDPSCSFRKQANLARLSWFNSEGKRKQVRAGRPVSILSMVEHSDVSGITYTSYGALTHMKTTRGCLSRTVFTPVPGRSYRMRILETGAGVCQTQVVDMATGQIPYQIYVDEAVRCIGGRLTR